MILSTVIECSLSLSLTLDGKKKTLSSLDWTFSLNESYQINRRRFDC